MKEVEIGLCRTGPSHHLVVPSFIKSGNNNVIDSPAMIDSGATGQAFIDSHFARTHSIPLTQLPSPCTVTAFDGKTPEAGPITHFATVDLSIDNHRERLTCYATDLGDYPLILGLPWLRKHDPDISFAQNTVAFTSRLCQERCLRQRSTTPVRGLEKAQQPRGLPHDTSISLINAAAFTTALKHDTCAEAGRFSMRDLEIALRQSQPTFTLSAQSGSSDEPALTDIVPPEYHDFLDVFSKQDARVLPPHRPYDHKIPL